MKQKPLADKDQLGYRPHLLDVATLLVHLYWALQEEDIGFSDADYTLEQVTTKLSRRTIEIPKAILESALWACNMLHEKGQFYSLLQEDFPQFVERLLGEYDATFNYTYNWITDPREKPTPIVKDEEEEEDDVFNTY